MSTKTWNFKLDGKEHEVELKSKAFSVVLVIDDTEKKFKRKKTYGLAEMQYPFEIGKHSCYVLIKPGALKASYDLVVDGKSINSGKEVKKQHTPKWAWAFVAACIAIPIVALGGAIPCGLGFGGAFGCLSIARSPRSKKSAILLCTAITAVVWILFIALILAVYYYM